MSLTADERNTLVTLSIEKACKFLSDGDKVAEMQMWSVCANRYYYACFHAIQGLLVYNHLAAHTHSGVLNMFHLHFVKEGKVNMDMGSFISRLEQLRDKADYNCYYDVTEADIADMGTQAHELIETIKQMVNYTC